MSNRNALQSNPLVNPPQTKNGVPPFDKIKTEHFLPAIEWGIAQAKANIAKIKAEANPTFQNIIEAYEYASEDLGRIMGIYGNYTGMLLTDELQQIESTVSEKLNDYSAEISFDKDLFKQIKAVYDQKDSLNLTPDQDMLLEDTYKGFVRSGALLPDKKQKRLKQINRDLSQATIRFKQNVQKDMTSFIHFVSDAAGVAGLPDSAKAAAAALAKAKGKDGQYAFTLQAPSYIPVLQYAENRQLRETIFKASKRMGNGANTDNKAVIMEIIKLRHERAKINGYNTHADYVLVERMAGSIKAVMDQQNYLKAKAKPVAVQEFEELKQFIADQGGPSDIRPWDVFFYTQKLKESRYGFDPEVLRPYFEFDAVSKGAFEVAGRLFGIRFEEKTADYPVYDPHVKIYEVKDGATDKLIGVTYTDYFPRDTKRPGAWMSTYRDQGIRNGKNEVPIVGLHGNFTPPSDGQPALLTFDEVNTFFHELGHGLHGLLSDVRYPSQAGTNVKWDFVELPSQLMENWLSEKKVLDMFARHYQTGQTIPSDLHKKMKKAEKFNIGNFVLRQAGLGTLDMKWHTTDPATITDVEAFEKEVAKDFTHLPHETGLLTSTSFSHIFAGGYSAGYYSYKWAEVLDADAFEAFKEEGLRFDANGKIKPGKTAKAFRKLMSQGGSRDPMELYKEFRGREPDPDALLRRDGLLPEKKPQSGKKPETRDPKGPKAG